MKAIQITQALKDANTRLGAIGVIQIFNSIPKTFSSLNYNVGQRTDGYNKLSNTVHEADGFYNVVTPTINEPTEKLGGIIWDATNSVFTYPVQPKTAAEQEQYTQDQEDNDTVSLTIQQHKANGVLGFDRAMALIERRFINGVITGAQAKAFAESIYPEIEPLYKGMWRIAKLNLENVDPPTNVDLLNIFNVIKLKIENYVAEKY